MPFKIYFHLSIWIFGLKLFIKSSYNTLMSLQSIIISIFSFLLLINLLQFHKSCRILEFSMSETQLFIRFDQFAWSPNLNGGDVKWPSGCYACIEFALHLKNPKLKNILMWGYWQTWPTFTPQRDNIFIINYQGSKQICLLSGGGHHHYLSELFALQTFL